MTIWSFVWPFIILTVLIGIVMRDYTNNLMFIGLLFIPYFLLFYIVRSSMSWDMYILDKGIGFKNRFKILGRNKISFEFDKLMDVKINMISKGGPQIVIITANSKHVFQSIKRKEMELIIEWLESNNVRVFVKRKIF